MLAAVGALQHSLFSLFSYARMCPSPPFLSVHCRTGTITVPEDSSVDITQQNMRFSGHNVL